MPWAFRFKKHFLLPFLHFLKISVTNQLSRGLVESYEKSIDFVLHPLCISLILETQWFFCFLLSFTAILFHPNLVFSGLITFFFSLKNIFINSYKIAAIIQTTADSEEKQF